MNSGSVMAMAVELRTIMAAEIPQIRAAGAVLAVQRLADLGALLLIGKVAFFAASRRLTR